ncbi:RHS repeat-associated core domain-containing protein [Herbidospora sp. NBRC 101105]|uniref:RHS repeat-associated core domain-containing protein n=1 Tax=Herbidospora sp. NBRC 101105 TaxID=3032195 RepID=UPI0024A070C1|nr:RHS repeat-associated core domain-containing protein [Herbidospora sp. NBRC 101105]GLX96737.1 hypothetical protein Hesp01_46870 [Herbidospora sp. NBRC 101105]
MASILVLSAFLTNVFADANPPGANAYAASRELSVAPDESIAARAVPVPGIAPGAEDAPFTARRTPELAWPKAARADITVPSSGEPVAIANLPVKIGPARSPDQSRTKAASPLGMRLETFGDDVARRVGGVGMMIRLIRTDGTDEHGTVTATIDYSSFRGARKGGFASRLQLVEVPHCMLAVHPTEVCKHTYRRDRRAVPVENDSAGGTLTAQLQVAPATSDSEATGLYAVASAAAATDGGSSGNFQATDLKPSGTWQVGLSGGAFSYSYPIAVPPGPGGSGPELALEYNSASVDGLTGGTNNQASVVGMGWDLNVGFIEQSFHPCGSAAEMCWDAVPGDKTTPQLTLSVDGRSSPIVKDSVTGSWKTAEDYGWKIESLPTSTSGSTAGKPYWQITTQEGTVYRFGYHRASSLQQPYQAENIGEPCHSGYPTPATLCVGPYRWMLDREVDRNGNVIDYAWQRVSRTYCSDALPWSSCGASYDSDAYLTQITYGHNLNVAGSAPTARVILTTVGRSLGGRADFPEEEDCPPTQYCIIHPMYYKTSRLSAITTQTWSPGAAQWEDLLRFELTQRWVDTPADPFGEHPILWLDAIRPIGMAGTSPDIVQPKVRFDAVLLDNLYVASDPMQPEYLFPRMSAVENGLGGRTEVTYGQPSGCSLSTESSATSRQNNTKDCYWTFVRYWVDAASQGHTEGDVWNKWLVTKVVERDLVGGSPDMQTRYEYLGGAGWARPGVYQVLGGAYPGVYEWTDFRGYPTVRTLKGAGVDPSQFTVSTTSFFRGMYDDLLNNGTARGTTVSDFDGNSYADKRELTGRTLQDQSQRVTGMSTPVPACQYPAWRSGVTYQAGARVTNGGHHWQAIVSNSSFGGFPSGYWTDLGACPMTASIPNAFGEETSVRYEYQIVPTGNGPGFADPHIVNQTKQVAREKISTGWRYSEVSTTYDTAGLPIKVNDYGERGIADDNTCTSTTYARNTSSAWLVSFIGQEERRSGDDCAAGTLLDRTVTLYDGATTEAANVPTIGNPTEKRSFSSDTTYVTTKSTFDAYGRTTSATDPLGHTSSTIYAPPTGMPLDGIVTTNPLGHSVTSRPAPWGSMVAIEDADGREAMIDYDALGRTVAYWTPSQPKSSGTPLISVTYAIPSNPQGQVTGPPLTTTSRLIGLSGGTPVYAKTYKYDDGLGRDRETQVPSPAGGRVVTVSTYDQRGLTVVRGRSIYNSALPGSGLLNPAAASIPQWAKTVYDGLERVVVSADMSQNVELRRTTSSYFGDRVEVVPPVGGKTVTRSDVADRVTKIEEWRDATSHSDTTYEYDVAGRLTQQVDGKGNVRTFTYDLLGRRLGGHDPDTGDAQQGYDAAGRMTWSIDGAGVKTSYTYDELNRKTAVWAGEPGDGEKLAEWVYDTLSKGKLTSSTRFADGNAYVDTVTGYDTDGRVTGSRLTIPSAEGPLAGDYAFSVAYTPAGGIAQYGMPAAGGLSAETLTSTYTALGLPDKLESNAYGNTAYVSSTAYSATGRPTARTFGTNGKLRRTFTWDTATGWLSRLVTESNAQSASPVLVQDDRFSYTPTGEITRVLDAMSAQGTSPGQSECFQYDSRHRLSSAFTTTGADCTAAPDQLGIDPYSQTYTYDAVGNIESRTTNGQTETYAYPAAGTTSVRPNAVSSVARPSGTDTYQYDAAGRMISRTVENTTSAFEWNELGELTKTTVGTDETEMVYDAEGERLIRRDPDGTSTLYLGAMEIKTSAGQLSATRYYTSADGTLVAMRSSATGAGGGLRWLAAGLHGSMQVAVDDATGAVARERYLPFGARRGQDDLPFTEKGFLGKTEDPSADLVYLSARYYDPQLGKFLSPDPLLDLNVPELANAYSYAGNNPIGLSDPTGLSVCSSELLDKYQYKKCVDYERNQEKACAKNAKSQACKDWEQIKDTLDYVNSLLCICVMGDPDSLKKILGEDLYNQLGAAAGDFLFALMATVFEDAIACVSGDLGSCATFAIGFVPGAKIGQLAAKFGIKSAAIKKMANRLAGKVGFARGLCFGGGTGAGCKGHFLLGLDNGVSGGLEQYAKKLGLRSFMHLSRAEAAEAFEAAVRSGAKFTFNLDGFVPPGKNMKEYLESAMDGALDYGPRQGNMTNWELAILQKYGQLGKVRFMLNGKVIKNPFA